MPLDGDKGKDRELNVSALFVATMILGSATTSTAADYKTGTWRLPTIEAPPSATAPALPPDPYNPALGWQTDQPSIICETYFRVNDGVKAALSGEKKWLAETGCIIAGGGLRLVLLDTNKVNDTWRARLYGPSGDSRDVYLRSVDVVGFANAGTYKSEKEAQTALAEMKRRFKRQYERDSDLPHRIVPEPEHVKLWIGPGTHSALYNFCDAAQEDKEAIAKEMAQSKREAEEYTQALLQRRPGEPTPKPASHVELKPHHLNCKPPSRSY